MLYAMLCPAQVSAGLRPLVLVWAVHCWIGRGTPSKLVSMYAPTVDVQSWLLRGS